MKHAWNRSRTFRGDSGGMYDVSVVGELDQPMLARLGAQCTGAADVDVIEHVLNVARVVTAARVRHLNDRGRRRTLGQVHAPTASEGDRL